MMHRERMKPKYSLEDYIYDMEARSVDTSVDHEDLDVYARLQQKENDLILAAQLGKALLEKNEELSKQNEKIVEQYNQKLELVEQDRHLLKRKLSTTRAECETRILELQADLAELSKNIGSSEHSAKQAERDKTALIQQLSEQNTRLTAQLRESSRIETELKTENQELRDQNHLKKSSLHDHVLGIDVLREEITMMTDKKTELEKRLQLLLSEREGLASALDEATDKIVMLEHQTREHELMLRNSSREVEHLTALNGSMSERIEALSSHGSSPANTAGHRSLLMEMECDDSNESFGMPLSETDQLHNLKQEILVTYQQLRSVCDSLRVKRANSVCSDSDSMSGGEDVSVNQVQVGLLTDVVKQLLRIIDDLLGGRERNLSTSSGIELELELSAEVHRLRELLEKTQRQINDKEDVLKSKTNEVMALTSKLTIREAELAGVTEERDIARADLATMDVSRDELVSRAREARDAAVARKNECEVELARTTTDAMQLSGQLLEAVQQKVQLSQQLEQWQMDMHCLLDDQMKQKLTQHERRMQKNKAIESEAAKKPSRSIFGLFQR